MNGQAVLEDDGRRLTDVAFALAIVFILSILFLPLPVLLIDFGLALSLSTAVLILMVALWIDRPLDFSAFPTVLLVSTMLRLSLNIATTRRILTDGHHGPDAAGHVIAGFSNFVMGSDFLIGVVVFIILITVNFVVITKGSTRIAEVGARFTLDAIPGKQMSIDADLSAGVIDDKEAQKRRRELEEESAFFGSMDGASKFVRGDAVAGLIITAVNIFGGIAIGLLRHDMPISEAADVFMKLSVGDGIVTQIPALIVSLAAGLLVSKGGTRGSADYAIFKQLAGYPRALFVAALLLVVLALMPGLPFLPFILIALMMAGVGQNIVTRRRLEVATTAEAVATEKLEKAQAEEMSVKSNLKTEDIELVLGRQLAASLVSGHQEMARRMAKMRRKFASEFGYVVPEIKLGEDLNIAPKSYQIRIHGTTVAAFELRIGELMALVGSGELPDIPGEPVREPAYGMQAISVSASFADDLRRQGIQAVDNISVILTHLSEVLRTNMPQLFSYRDMRILIERLEPEYRKLCDETCTNQISYAGFQAVLKALLAERVSIRNLHLIIEAVAEIAPHVRRTEKIVEHVRVRNAQQLCGDIARDGVLKVLRLGARWELAFVESLKKDAKGEIVNFEMDPRQLEQFATDAQATISRHHNGGEPFAIVTTPDARPYVRMITERNYPGVPVLSHAELARGMKVDIIGAMS